MDEHKLHICPVCHGTGFYEEKNDCGPNTIEDNKKVKCESCEGTGTITPVYHNSYWMRRLGKNIIIK
jgi:DnaJ-class molecular chaperone